MKIKIDSVVPKWDDWINPGVKTRSKQNIKDNFEDKNIFWPIK